MYRLIAWTVVAAAAVLGFSCSSAPKKSEPTVLSATTATAGGVAITDEMIEAAAQ